MKDKIDDALSVIKQNQKKIFILCIFAVFGIMFALNTFTPYMSDDFPYSGSGTILNAFKNQCHEYLTWTGRFFTVLLVRVFLLGPKMFFNFFNSLAYVSLTILIYIFARPKKKYDICLYLLINIMLWLFIVDFGEVFLWLTGACEYLMGLVIILSFLLPYHRYIHDRKQPKSPRLWFVLMLVGGILAGWCSENTSGGALLLVICALCYCKYHKYKIPVWMFSGLSGIVIGLIGLVAAPGNYVRMQRIIDKGTPGAGRDLFATASRFFRCTRFIYDSSMIVIAIFLLLFILRAIYNKDKKSLWFPVIYFVVAMAMLYVFVLSPVSLNHRAMLGVVVFIITGAMYCLAGIDVSNPVPKFVSVSLSAILCVPFFSTFIIGSMDIVFSGMLAKRRDDSIRASIAMGVKNVITYKLQFPEQMIKTTYNPLYGLEEESINSKYRMNPRISKYYGINSIAATDYDTWERLYKNHWHELVECIELEEYIQSLTPDRYTVFVVAGGGFNRSCLPLDIQNSIAGEGDDIIDNCIIIMDSGSYLIRNASDEPVYYSGEVGDLSVRMASGYSAIDSEDVAKINIDGVEYSRNQSGLNFVVYDKNESRIVDSVAFIENGTGWAALR